MMGFGMPGGGPPKFGGKFYGSINAFPAITDSPLYTRGDVDKPGDKVPRGFVSVLSTGDAPAIPQGASGRRELADWLTA